MSSRAWVWGVNPSHMDVSKNRGKKTKMDGENNGSRPYEQMDDLGVFPYFWFNTHIYLSHPFTYFQLIQPPSPPWRTHLAPPQHHIGPRTRQGLVSHAKIEKVDKFESTFGQNWCYNKLTKYNFEELVIFFHCLREKTNIWQLCVFFISLPHASF